MYILIYIYMYVYIYIYICMYVVSCKALYACGVCGIHH